MSDCNHFDLRAAALPRIGLGVERANRRPRHPLPPLSRKVAQNLLTRLDARSRGFLPFSLGPTGEWGMWTGLVLAATVLGLGVLTWFGQSWAWGVGVPGLLIVLRGAALLRHQDARRKAVALREHLQEEGRVADLEQELVAYMNVAPEDPAARYLLALARVERARPLEALLQLATLRDRYPAAGEVVLLAAIACAQLDRPGRAGRLLGALNMDPAHPWWDEIVRFANACGSVGPRLNDDMAESGLPG